MSYVNTSVSTFNNILDQIITFATSEGWTINKDGFRDSPAETSRHIIISHPSKPGYYFNLVESVSNSQGDNDAPVIVGMIATGVSVGDDYDEQPGIPPSLSYDITRLRIRVLPVVSIHCFSDNSVEPYLNFAIEIQSGNYRHLNIGFLDTYGSFNSPYIACAECNLSFVDSVNTHAAPFLLLQNNTQYSLVIRAPDEINSSNQISYSSSSSGSARAGYPSNIMGSFLTAQPNNWNLRSALHVPLVYAILDSTNPGNNSARLVPVGKPLDFRYINMTYFTPGEELVIGSDTWVIFPMIRKTNFTVNSSGDRISPSEESSYIVGIAYRKVV